MSLARNAAFSGRGQEDEEEEGEEAQARGGGRGSAGGGGRGAGPEVAEDGVAEELRVRALAEAGCSSFELAFWITQLTCWEFGLLSRGFLFRHFAKATSRIFEAFTEV